MPLEDFSRKQKDKFRKVLEKLLSEGPQLKAGEFVTVREEINVVLKRAIDLNLEELTLIPVERFASTLEKNDSLNDENMEKLAALFLALGLEEGRPRDDGGETGKLLERALAVLQYLERKSATYSFERNAAIDRIIAALADNR